MGKVYFIGIAGSTMAALAKAFKDMGWQVSGSDQKKVYPPVSEYLKENTILYFKGYQEKNLPLDADLVVVGRSSLLTNANNPEYLKAVKSNLKVLSYPEVIKKYLIKEKSIVVAGTYGKSTTTALITWILINAGLDPSYMFGGFPINFMDGTKITVSLFSVVEGDETPALRESDQPKFTYYRPKYLLLTATEYDHPEVFKNNQDYLKVFIKLVQLLPKDGILFYDSKTVDQSVVDACKCQKVAFDSKDIFLVPDVLLKESAVRAKILCLKLNIDEKIIDKSISSFKGLKGRNEFLGKFGGRYLYCDLAQQSSKVKAGLSLVKKKHPKSSILVIFNPSATSLKYKENLNRYAQCFDQADRVLVNKVDFIKNVSGEKRVTGLDLVNAFGGKEKVFYMPIPKNIIDWLKNNSKKEDVIIFMSSGGLNFISLINKTINELKN